MKPASDAGAGPPSATTSASALPTSPAARSSTAAAPEGTRPERACSRSATSAAVRDRTRAIATGSSPAARRSSRDQIRRGSSKSPCPCGEGLLGRLQAVATDPPLEPVHRPRPRPGGAAEERDDRGRRALARGDLEQLEEGGSGRCRRQWHARLRRQRNAHPRRGCGRSAAPGDRGCARRSRSRRDRRRRRAGGRPCARSAPPRRARRHPRADAVSRPGRSGPTRARTGCARGAAASADRGRRPEPVHSPQLRARRGGSRAARRGPQARGGPRS